MITPEQKYGKLTVKEFVKKDKYYNKYFRVVCDCGVEKVMFAPNLVRKTNAVRSCGCTKTHGMTNTLTYRSWSEMLRRARGSNVNRSEHKNYAGRGIGVCGEWSKFETFLKDMGERPSKKYSIDRIDNDRGYEPNNCRWATAQEQSRNKRTTNFADRDAIILSMKKDGASLREIAETFNYKSHSGIDRTINVKQKD